MKRTYLGKLKVYIRCFALICWTQQ